MLPMHAQAWRVTMGSQFRCWRSGAQDLFQHQAAEAAGGALQLRLPEQRLCLESSRLLQDVLRQPCWASSDDRHVP